MRSRYQSKTPKQHENALQEQRGGKPTESVLLRFNEREFYLLNLASRLAISKGFRSRQEWMRHIMQDAIESEMMDAEGMETLVDEFLRQPPE